jgi:hypothetical protein
MNSGQKEVVGIAIVCSSLAGLTASSLAQSMPEWSEPAGRPARAEAAPDIGGAWLFHERIWVLQPSELNALIGAPTVDEPMTQVICEAEGTIELEQVGTDFQGTATQNVICSVGGVAFVPPEFAFNPEFTINAGWLYGNSIHFETGHTLNVCDNRGSVKVRDGTAVLFRAEGDCPVPFHPGEHHSSWTVWRP